MQENVKIWLEDYFSSNHNSKHFNYINLPKSLSLIYKIFKDKNIFYFKTLKHNTDFLNKESLLIPQLKNIIPDLVELPVLSDLENNWILSKAIPNNYAKYPLHIKIQIIQNVLKELQKVKNINLKIKDKDFLIKNLTLIQYSENFFSPEIFKNTLDILSCINYPINFIHGDLTFYNIITHKEEIKIIDWTDSCYSYNIVDFLFLEFFDAQEKKKAYSELLGYKVTDNEYKNIEIVISVYYLITYYHLKDYAPNFNNALNRYKDRINGLLI